jgi:uncharacterized protein (DUF1800 family)
VTRTGKALALCVCCAALATLAAGGARKIPRTKLTPEQRASHLLNRITYGPRPGQVAAVMAQGEAAFLEAQLHPEAIDDSAVEKRLASAATLRLSSLEIAALFPPPGAIQRLVRDGEISREDLPRGFRRPPQGDGEAPMMRRPDVDFDFLDYQIQRLPEPVRAPGQQGRFAPRIEGVNPPQVVVAQLQAAKLIRAVESERQLLEVMTDFWFNHFNVFMGKPQVRNLVTEYERDVIRPNALGRFRDLLGAVAHSPAMQVYLDNAQSFGPESPLGRRQNRGLNENYARELLELHTLGVDGGYTQQDVTEAARVLTGWTPAGLRFARFGGDGGFLEAAHDQGEKTVLGTKFEAGGVLEGEKLLDELAAHPATARFLAAKLVRRFVADDPPEKLVDAAAKTYARTGGDIREVLRTIFYSKEFWSPETYRAKAKKPLELTASTLRALGASAEPNRQLLGMLERLGEPLYLCQPPTGYDDVAEAWLGSDQLVLRWNFALGAVVGRIPGVEPAPGTLEAEGSTEERLDALVQRFWNEKPSPEARQRLLAAAEEVPPQALAALVLGAPEFQRR